MENCSPKCLSVILLPVSYRTLITNDIPFCLAGNKSQREELDSILFLFEVSFPRHGSSCGCGAQLDGGAAVGRWRQGAAWAPRREQPGRAVPRLALRQPAQACCAVGLLVEGISRLKGFYQNYFKIRW